MGNRAVISLHENPLAKCVYVHWNGGRASVEGYLRAAQLVGLKAGYGLKDFHSLVQGYLGSSAYFEDYGRADKDNWDNGTYLINCDWEIIGRKFVRHGEEINAAKTREIAIDCIAAWHHWPN